MDFKDRLRDLREAKGFSTAKLAGQFDKSEGAIRMWETGRSKPDADTLIALASFFGVTTDYLLGISNASHPENQKLVDDLGLSEGSIKVLHSEKLNSHRPFDNLVKKKRSDIDTRSLKYILDLLLTYPALDLFLEAVKNRTIPYDHFIGAQWEDGPIDWSFMEDGNIHPSKEAKDIVYRQRAHELLDDFIQYAGNQSVKRWVAEMKKINLMDKNGNRLSGDE